MTPNPESLDKHIEALLEPLMVAVGEAKDERRDDTQSFIDDATHSIKTLILEYSKEQARQATTQEFQTIKDQAFDPINQTYDYELIAELTLTRWAELANLTEVDV